MTPSTTLAYLNSLPPAERRERCRAMHCLLPPRILQVWALENELHLSLSRNAIRKAEKDKKLKNYGSRSRKLYSPSEARKWLQNWEGTRRKGVIYV